MCDVRSCRSLCGFFNFGSRILKACAGATVRPPANSGSSRMQLPWV